jgi:hypothetical protein
LTRAANNGGPNEFNVSLLLFFPLCQRAQGCRIRSEKGQIKQFCCFREILQIGFKVSVLQSLVISNG